MGDEARPDPGWYAAPGMPGAQRYWDGETWTDHVAPAKESDSGATVTLANLLVVLLCLGIAVAVVLVVGSLVD